MLRYIEIKRNLTDLVIKMHPGEKLPSRLSLCKKLDTSRVTLDKAIEELRQEGVLYSIKGSGTYVNALIQETVPVTENWGLILPNVMTPVFVEITRAIENFTESKGINLILCNSDEDIEKQENYIRRLTASPVSGFIMIPVVCDDLFQNINVYGRLLETRIPLVFCSRVIPSIDVPVVMINNFYGGYIATRHLISRGYRHIAFVAAHRNNKGTVTGDRCQGYISALMEEGIPVNHRLILIDNSHDIRGAYTALRALLDSGEPVDAVFGINDEICSIVYDAIRDSGKRVSTDVGVIGFDNLASCETMKPPLSSVTYRGMDIGYKAAEILWNTSHNLQPKPDYPYYFCQPQLAVRSSSLGPGLPVEPAESDS